MSSSKEGDKDSSRKVKIQKRPELTNGGSLEDCISNVYSLLELPGIKWKCYRTKSNAPRGVPLTTDSVLKAYSKCVLDGILCTWRRKQLTATGNNELLPLPHFSNDSPKELWVFWYDDEPATLQQHCEGLEVDEEMSSASQMNIVSYEVRTILFKALHVVMERDLTKDGFVRFGRWFTVPLETRAHYLHYMYPTYSPALRLNFFVHGANTVCAAVQAQRQPTLLTLAKRHLEYKSTKRFAVIVGPWSMRGILVQDQLRLLNDPKMQETAENEWNHWKEYLQMEEKEPEKVPDSERKGSPEPETPQPTPHRSLLTDSSDEELAQSTEAVPEPINEEIPARLRWMYEPECRTEKTKEETAEEKEKREQDREVRRKRRKDREDRRKEVERQRTEGTNPEDYDSEVVTDAEEEAQEECVNNDVPKMVLLEIDGVRMLYPSKFICVTLEDDRHVLESMGLKTSKVPGELQVQGRRPRNKFVVNVANPILSTQAVWQSCFINNKNSHDHRVADPSPAGFEGSLPRLKTKFFHWDFSTKQRCDRIACKLCKGHYKKGIKTGQFNLTCSDSKELYRDVVNRVRRKNDFDAYHKKRRRIRIRSKKNEKIQKRLKRLTRKMRRIRYRAKHGIIKKPKFIMSKKRQRMMAQKEALLNQRLEEKDEKKRAEKLIKDELRPTDAFRADSEDESFQMDKLSQQDWTNFEDEGSSSPVEEVEEGEKEPEILNTIKIAKPEHDENFSPDPFLPLSFVSRKTNSSDFEYKVGDDDMSEERFNEVYRDKSNKWRPGMSRSEKIECGDYQVDPSNQQKGSPRPYHVKELPKKIRWEAKLPMPRNNKYFKGAICKRGLRGSEEMWIRRDKIHEKRKANYIMRYRKSVSKHQIRVAKWCAKKLESQMTGRSLEKAVQNLKKIAGNDSRSEGTKQFKLSIAKRDKKYDDKKKELLNKNSSKVEDLLEKLDVNSFCAQHEQTGPQGVGMLVGYVSPQYATSPNSHVDYESETDSEEQRNGLGEGTSMQYQDGDPVDVDNSENNQYVDDAMIGVTETIGHARTAGEHVGPDGLLSPPASNEMPKGGPLSVGPPSIESQGLNQIYPTPPSVQMLQGDAAQAHSPLFHGKSRCMTSAIEDDIERISVPGGGATIVEIEADDAETENMKKWKEKATRSKISEFLASSYNDPVLSAKKRKYNTPITEKFKIEEKTKKVSAGLVYKNMVTRKFEHPPHRSFADLVRSRIHEKRIASLTASSLPPAIPPSVHQSSAMVPMFQSPAMPSHIPSPAVGPIGPMGGHPMAGHGFPGTPGPFPPTTPTYPGMMHRPGPNFGPGPAFNHQMMGHGFNNPMGQMGQMGAQRPPFMNPQNVMHSHSQMQMMRMQQQMMQNRSMGGQGMHPGYGPGMPHYSPGPSTPGPNGYGMQHQGASSVQQLNMFVNQSRFGANVPSHSGQPPPYGNMQQMIPQSPSFNQPYGGMNNPMMSPMQQHQFHQQQMQQQMQMQHHQQQMQRNQMQQQLAQHHQMMPPPAQQLQMQQQQQLRAALSQLTPRQKKKFALRQHQLLRGVKPTSLQPVALRKMANPPDANIHIKKLFRTTYRPPETHVPEGDSLTIALILSDTILDLHFDSVFDSCPICSCSVSIRSRDLGMYITPHEVLRTANPGHSNMREHTLGTWSGFHVNSATNCTCGFSAIRHRYLSCCSGLFAEDANEATTLDNAVAAVVPPMDFPKKNTARNMSWFDSRSVHDMALLDQIRQMAFSNSLGKAISQMATVREHRRDMAKAMEIDMDITVPSEYVISHVDSLELLMLGNSAIEMSMKMSSIRNQTVSAQKFLTYFHPWGLQTANEIPELEANEWVDLLGTVTSTLEGAVKMAKPVPDDTTFAIDGPMTWKQFVSKSIKGRPNADEEEDYSLAEPIPAVMRATDKEAIRAAPHIDQYYEQAGLGPVDQPKDVMYIAIIPDDEEVYEQTVAFMNTVSETYEKMRLGHHIPFPVSTETATRYREVYRTCKENYTLPEQHQQLVSFVNQSLMRTPQKLAEESGPVDPRPEKWAKDVARKSKVHESFKAGPGPDFLPDYKGTHEEFGSEIKKYHLFNHFDSEEEHPAGFFEREGILRVGTPFEPMRIPLAQTVTSTAEFHNMTKHLKDNEGFVTRLKIYLQQMEDLVTNALIENAEAFERRGYRYQLAVEERLKRREDERKKEEERMRYNAAREEDDRLAPTAKKPEEGDIIPGTELSSEPTEDYVDDEEEERKLQKQREDEQYPSEGQQAPSPIPAGMVHIPETLSEQERTTQPSLTDLLNDPSSVMPHNAANIAWKQRDTSVPNPFPSSNQPPVPFESVGSSETDDYATLPHVIVIYMINPFNYGPEGSNALHMRIAILSFIRVFNAIMGRLPFNKRPQLQLEIVGMESIDEISKPLPDYFNDPKIPFDILHDRPSRLDKPTEWASLSVARSLSIAVYTHPRVFFPDVYKPSSARCMTAFGPGSQIINTINDMDRLNADAFQCMSQRSKTALHFMESATAGFRHPGMMPQQQIDKKNYIAYRIPSTIVCLAPPPMVCQMEENGKPLLNPIDEQTLFVAYCLVGTDFLVATATDAQGKLIDNCIANIKPRRQNNELYRYKHKTQILDGMGKLWSFILGIMSSEIKNWRLVVGRLGRIGHGEFRAWTHLLNKTSLLRYSGSLKDICGACRSMPSIVGTPAILSACLISLEPEPSIRIIPEFFDYEASSKKNPIFQTPGDLSSTHILTFPVGAEINLEVQDQTVDPKADENWEFGDLDIMEGLDDGDTEIMKDLGLETPSSAAIRQPGVSSMFFSEDSSTIEIQNQPLASGYYISTAPAPELPTWFWATCPSAKRHCPVHLKSSLHINISEVKNDDIAMESTKEKDKEKEKEEKDTHPLESRQTEEVLRHVLESYNALSWLNMNRQNGERYSCLPIHIQHLLRLYHSVARLLA